MSVRGILDKKFIITGVLVLVTAASYWRSGDMLWVGYDDCEYVTDNVHVQAGLSHGGLGWAFKFYAANWHPLSWLSHALDYQLYGNNPAGHHATSLIIHLLNTALLFWVLHLITTAVWRSAFVAALFGLHPLNVESVAWVAERKNVLSTLFLLLTILAYWRYARRPGLYRYVLVVVMFALGLAAKPMLVTLPFALLLLDYWP